jgi:hypothetical protein
MRRISLLAVLLGVVAAPVGSTLFAAGPPSLLNYQGVLRDASDKPRNGAFDMTFHFFDADTAGNEILVDAHTGGGAVAVTNGLFNVQLGSGVISDGSGPGFFNTLDVLFRTYDTVYMEVQIGAETLSPRIRVVAAAYALNAGNLGGQPPGAYLDTSTGGQIKEGALACDQGLLGYNDSGMGFGFGIWGRGLQGGGEFRDYDNSGFADVATGDYGIDASGNSAGGNFHSLIGTGLARAGTGNIGLSASGSTAGGQFQSSSGNSNAFAGYPGYGIFAYGSSGGGYFYPQSGSPEVYLGTPSYAVDADVMSSSGALAGRFRDLTSGALVKLADPTWGTYSTGPTGGAFVSNVGSSSTTIANGNWGIHAVGAYCGQGCGGGGNFQDSTGTTISYVAYSNVGIETHASGSGGSFYNTSGTATAVAAAGGIGLSSNGTKNFVQNHPEDPGAVIAYASLEGDEAGTYTRGTARLSGGEARIPLGETFQWVTNPDLGLTAHLTPVGDWADLYVAAKSTKEIVVRSRDPRAGDVTFDYLVLGLRIGFEESPVVREKEHEMPIPTGVSGETLFAKRPDLARFTPLARFTRQRKEVAGKDSPIDLSASEALKSKIHVFDSARDGEAYRAPAVSRDQLPPASPDRSIGAGSIPGPSATGGASGPAAPTPTAAPFVPGPSPPDREIESAPSPPFPPETFPVEVDGTVRSGDVITITDAPAGKAVLAGQPTDRGVIGIVGGARADSWTGRAPLVLAGAIALCNVDATADPITAGDLLVSSSTPGHAMRAKEAPVPGTVVGKALESLEGGTGSIRVLVLNR